MEMTVQGEVIRDFFWAAVTVPWYLTSNELSHIAEYNRPHCKGLRTRLQVHITWVDQCLNNPCAFYSDSSKALFSMMMKWRHAVAPQGEKCVSETTVDVTGAFWERLERAQAMPE